MRPFSTDLHIAALGYTQQGYAVIPVRGDGDAKAPKAAGVKWEHYRAHKPAREQIDQWFTQPQGGLAILTGRVSQLVVLDFDDLATYERFSRQLPELINTYTVRSAGRGTPHLYFKMTNIGLATRHVRGMDVLSDGCYVVAPPTVIGGKTYVVERDVKPLALTAGRAMAILEFLEKSLVVSRQSLVKTKSAVGATESVVPTLDQISKEVVKLYRARAGQGRNQALFEAGRFGRDQGLGQEAVLGALATVHMSAVAPLGHAQEAPIERLQEARRTIASVFSRPARKLTQPQTIPTRVSEALYAQQATYAVRVLNGLRLKGFEAGKIFMAEQALDALKGIVGRDSVYAALKTVGKDGVRMWATLSPRTPHTLNTANADIETVTLEETNAIGRGQKSGKNKRGRPAAVYRMPSNAELNALFDLPPSAADPMTLADMQSAKTTRAASHRELIRRRPGTYTRGFLAARLGVDRRTMRGYTRALGVCVQPTYQQTPIFWHNLNAICDQPLPGTFLQDADGKRYPPLKAIAHKLLKRKKPLWYMRQGANSYSHKKANPHSLAFTPSWREGIKPDVDTNAAVRKYWRALYAEKTTAGTGELIPATPGSPREITGVGREVVPEKWVKAAASVRVAKWDTGSEQVAGEVYEAVKKLADERGKKISRENARKLVEKYGAAVVSYSLKRLEWLALQPGYSVSHPAGLLVTLTRGNWLKMKINP